MTISAEEKKQIEEAIAISESNTSVEIRVHIESVCKENVMNRASYVFEKLEMHKTDLRNAILILIAIENKKMAILGDAGINQHMTQSDWNRIKDCILSYFQNGEIIQGIVAGVKEVGEIAKKHFPLPLYDVNELSNKVTSEHDV